MLSATTADNRLSIAARSATVTAEGISGTIISGRNSGIAMSGKPVGMPPNLVPMVSALRPKDVLTIVTTNRATIEPGTRLVTSGQERISTKEDSPMAVAVTLIVPRCCKSTHIFFANSLGTFSMVSPKKSFICVDAIRMAMPLVKPMVTGRGMNRTAPPSPVKAKTTRMTPAIIVHIKRPGTPKVVTIPATITTNAPVGPAIWHREPPSALKPKNLQRWRCRYLLRV